MNPKLIRWVLGLSLAGNVAAVGWWLRGRESEAGGASQRGRYVMTRDGASFALCDTVTGRVELVAVVDGKFKVIELLAAKLPAGWTAVLDAP